jgi:hypothetical protein
MENNCCIIVYAKAPVPGQVKTRLAPALDAEAAALLHAALVERALTIAQDSGLAHEELCCAPDGTHSFFQTCAEDFDVTLTGQGDGGLGERMFRTLARALQTHDAAIIIGADCPALTGKHVADAARALASHDVVLTPADDGGYVLIGACRVHDAMFDAIEWGTHEVLAQQRRQLQACGLSWHEMETLWDVDRPEDLPRLRALRPALEFFWPT